MSKTKKLPNLADKITKPEIICPVIRVSGETHPLEDKWTDQNFPELKAVGYARLNEGSNQWVSYTITTRGPEVTKIEISEPDLKAIAEESSKINFVTTFTDQE